MARLQQSRNGQAQRKPISRRYLAAHRSCRPDHRGNLVFNLNEDAVHKLNGVVDCPGCQASVAACFLNDAEIIFDERADLLLNIAELAG